MCGTAEIICIDEKIEIGVCENVARRNESVLIHFLDWFRFQIFT